MLNINLSRAASPSPGPSPISNVTLWSSSSSNRVTKCRRFRESRSRRWMTSCSMPPDADRRSTIGAMPACRESCQSSLRRQNALNQLRALASAEIECKPGTDRIGPGRKRDQYEVLQTGGCRWRSESAFGRAPHAERRAEHFQHRRFMIESYTRVNKGSVSEIREPRATSR